MSLSPKIIGERLKALRLKPPQMSQDEAAAVVNVSVRAWQRWEKGETSPDLGTVEKFAESRGESLARFIGVVSDPLDDEREIPIVDSIPAGPLLQGFGEGGVLGFVRASIRNPEAFALRVTGASMSPEIQEEDVVLCSPRAAFLNGRIYAVVVGEGEQSLKRVRHDKRSASYALIPTNKDVPTLYVPEREVLKLIRVVEVRRDLQ